MSHPPKKIALAIDASLVQVFLLVYVCCVFHGITVADVDTWNVFYVSKNVSYNTMIL
jgi:hypothetical protein